MCFIRYKYRILSKMCDDVKVRGNYVKSKNVYVPESIVNFKI